MKQRVEKRVTQFTTSGGVVIDYEQHELHYDHAIEPLLDKLDSHRGALFASSFEYPGRYTCWDVGFYNPPLVITCREEAISIEALNERGQVLLAICLAAVRSSDCLIIELNTLTQLEIKVKKSNAFFTEEIRSQQPSVFTVIRHLLGFFKSSDDPYLGLYGAFGYDLIFQFETLPQCKKRSSMQRDMVLYLPDEIYVVNHRKECALICSYEFQYQNLTTRQYPRVGKSVPYEAKYQPQQIGDHKPSEYDKTVETAKA